MTPAYEPPFHFTGVLYAVTIDVSGESIRDAEADADDTPRPPAQLSEAAVKATREAHARETVILARKLVIIVVLLVLVAIMAWLVMNKSARLGR